MNQLYYVFLYHKRRLIGIATPDKVEHEGGEINLDVELTEAVRIHQLPTEEELSPSPSRKPKTDPNPPAPDQTMPVIIEVLHGDTHSERYHGLLRHTPGNTPMITINVKPTIHFHNPPCPKPPEAGTIEATTKAVKSTQPRKRKLACPDEPSDSSAEPKPEAA